ncbi:MAG: RNase adaptor protein RapZ [Alphaproteobacteria bacterium GWF2_58_20]|nr:MAG: RNase adaptor protein RapZ [Alphaproteobacteria bacterium GWF2_58_20]
MASRHPKLPPRRVILVTGMSGAGLSTTIKALEDLGYETVDNPPLFLISGLLEQGDMLGRPLAIGLDSRTRGFSAEAFLGQMRELAARPGLQVQTVFIECGDDILLRRYTETRRKHPLALDRPVIDGILRERRLLSGLRDEASLVIDTSDMTLHDLRRLVGGHFHVDIKPKLSLFVMSFGFPHGVPREADIVLDARFLRNPHYDPILRPLTGKDAAVGEYVARDPDYPAFINNITQLIDPLLPRFQQEGKSYLTIAIGCTGGRHRSVFIAETLAEWIRDKGYPVGTNHRELSRQKG